MLYIHKIINNVVDKKYISYSVKLSLLCEILFSQIISINWKLFGALKTYFLDLFIKVNKNV